MRVFFAIALVASAGYALSEPRQSPQGPQVEAEKKADGAAQPKQISHTPQSAASSAPASDPVVVPLIQAQPAKPQREHGGEEASEFWPTIYGYRVKITDSLLVLFTFLLWRVTAGLKKSTDNLWVEARDASKIANKSADAAKRAADVAERALNDLERPYVFLDLRERVFPNLVMTSGGTHSINFPRSRTPIKYGLINRGRTPAFLTDLCQRLVSGSMPSPIDVGDPDLEGVVSLKGQDVGAAESYPYKIDFVNEQMSIESLYLIGFIRYTDIFQRKHITSFCAKFAIPENRFALIGGEQYNYTRDEGDSPPQKCSPPNATTARQCFSDHSEPQ